MVLILKTILTSTQTGGLFLESYFAYAIYDFLEIVEDTREYERLRGYNTESLRKIANEAFLDNREERTETKKVLLDILAGKSNLFKDVKHLLMYP